MLPIKSKVWQIVIGALALLAVWFWFLPLLTGVVHTVVAVIVVIVAILWVLTLGGLIS